jgi:hypothetical protein
MDRILGIVRWLFARPELDPVLPAELAGLFDGKKADALLYLGDLPVTDRLLRLLVRERRLGTLFEDAAAFLKSKGISARPVMTARAVDAASEKRVIAFCECCLPRFERSVEVVTLDSLAAGKKRGKPARRSAASEPDSGAAPDLLPGFRFRITPEERLALSMALQASTLLCTCPGQMAQLMLLLREGAWRTGSAPEPIMVFQEAVRDAAGEAVS